MQPIDWRRIIEEGTRAMRTARAALIQRTLLWAMLVICATLLVATVSEAWAHADAQARVQAARAHNAALRRDVQTTQRAIQVAQSPETIERQARAWGYSRPGEHPIVVATQGR
ncbi:MAG: septum formation initiator family protein [Ktedonobacterales bacterium]